MPDQLTQTFLSNLANVEKELPILALVDYDVPSPVSVVLCLQNFFVEGVRSAHSGQLRHGFDENAAHRLLL